MYFTWYSYLGLNLYPFNKEQIEILTMDGFFWDIKYPPSQVLRSNFLDHQEPLKKSNIDFFQCFLLGFFVSKLLGFGLPIEEGLLLKHVFKERNFFKLPANFNNPFELFVCEQFSEFSTLKDDSIIDHGCFLISRSCQDWEVKVHIFVLL